MALEIEWTSEAERNLTAIFDYLEQRWSKREIANFAEKLESTLQHLSKHPAIFRTTTKRKA